MLYPSSLYNWYQRKKKQVWGATLATAAGVAVAYFAYQWLYPPEDEDEDEGKSPEAESVPQFGTPGSAAVTENSRTSQNAGSISFGHNGQSHLERRLREQQATVQDIANHQTLPEMQGRLHQQLVELTGVESLTKDLRNLRPSAPPATATPPSTFPPTSAENAERMTRKLALWCDLRDQSFLLLVATTWLLPALILVIHVQLTIIGRSTYLEEIVNSREMPRKAPAAKRRSSSAVSLTETSIEPLTRAQQQAFLSYGTFLLESGMQNILPQIQKIVKHHVAKVDLQEKVSLAHLWHLLSQMHEEIDSHMPPSTWLAALLPPLVVHPNDLIAASTPSLGAFERIGPPQETPNSHVYSPDRASIGSPCTGTAFSGQGETPGVLEPQSQQPRAHCSFPDEFYPIGLDRASADAVAKLVLEAQEIVNSKRFLYGFQAGVKWSASYIADSLQSQFAKSAQPSCKSADARSPLGPSSENPRGVHSPHQNQNSAGDANGASGDCNLDVESISMATAAIVPRLAKSAEELLVAAKEDVAVKICQLPAVRALLDSAFACGPFLDMQD